jgi:glyoxylase-like metal-dependent hydrolase (beta-lactamase superfamily II)
MLARRLAFAFAALLAACASPAAAPSQDAVATVRRAAGVVGGADRLLAVRTLTYSFSGAAYWPHQGVTDEQPLPVRTTQHYYADLAARRLYLSHVTISPTVTLRPAGIVEANEPPMAELALRSPDIVLREALTHASELRSAPNGAVTTPFFGRTATLHFDAAGRLSRVDVPTDDPRRGDTATVVEFLDYAPQGDIVAPRRIRESVAGVQTLDVAVDLYQVDAAAAPEWSASMTPSPASDAPPPAPEPATIQTLAPGVHMVVGHAGPNYKSLVVELDDGLLLLETPDGDPGVLAEALTRISTRPFRYAAPTHHHDDHAGGVAMLPEGVTVLTTPGAVDYFTDMSGASRMLRTDRPARAPLAVRAMQQGERLGPVQFFNVGPHIHANEHFVFYFPDHGILYQSDLIRFPETGDPNREQVCVVANAIRRNGLNVTRIVGTHGDIATIAEFEAVLARRTTPCPA